MTMGYGLVNRRPWLILLPILLDCFYVIGPRLSAQALFDAFAASMQALATQSGASGRDAIENLRALGLHSDLFGLLAAFGAQSLVRALEPSQAPFLASRGVLAVDGWLQLALAMVVLCLGGILLAVAYAVPIGQAVRQEPAALMPLFGQVARSWLAVLGLYSLIVGAVLAVIVPLALVSGVMMLVNTGLGALIAVVGQLLVTGLALWLGIHLFFTSDAIVVSQIGPWRAMRASLAVVRRNFWPTCAFILLTLVITFGLTGVLFTNLATLGFGLPIAIVANAYIHTGLVAASMIFYRDRLGRLQPAVAPMPRSDVPR